MSEINFNLQPKQLEFMETVKNTPVTLYGGAKGGGKSKGIRDIMLIRRFENPKTHGGLFRRTYKELEGNHIRPILKEYPTLRKYWNDSKKILALPNGSSLEFCHCENDKDVENYQGREYEDLAIEEAGQWTEGMFKTLYGSNRSSRPGFKPRALLTGNPGGIGHAWLKRLFIDRRFTQFERPQDYAFIQALVQDNPALIKNDPDYVHRLQSEPNEVLRRAYLYGDWNVFAGQFFSELRREIHLIKPFDIPRHWLRFGSYDFGFNHPGAFGWFACDEDGNVYLYREFIKAQLRIDQFAKELNQYEDTYKLDYVVAGHDCWAKRHYQQATGPSIAEEFSQHGIQLRRAAIDRINGASHLRTYLAPKPKPRFYIFDTCPVTFDCLSRMQHDPDRMEDVLKVDSVDGDVMNGDDPYDMCRYGIMSRPPITQKLPLNLKAGTKEYMDFEAKRMEQNIDEQGARQMAEEREADAMAIAFMDPDDNPIKHYINKRRQ